MSDMKRVFLLAAMLVAALTPSIRAQDTAAGPDPESRRIHVVNNHGHRIRVVLVDEDGGHHPLGRVSNGTVGTFVVADPRADEWFTVKVFADEPVWSAANTGVAVRTRHLRLLEGAELRLWVERDLTDTRVTSGR